MSLGDFPVLVGENYSSFQSHLWPLRSLNGKKWTVRHITKILHVITDFVRSQVIPKHSNKTLKNVLKKIFLTDYLKN